MTLSTEEGAVKLYKLLYGFDPPVPNKPAVGQAQEGSNSERERERERVICPSETGAAASKIEGAKTPQEVP